MLQVIKFGCKFEIPKTAIVKCDATYDGALITLADNTEIRFTMSAGPQLRTLMNLIQTATSDIIILDLDAAISGQYDKVITLKNKEIPPAPAVVNTPSPTSAAPKKKLGRPAGTKNKKKTTK